METGKDILKELKEQAPGLADISREVPYKVPEGYFDNLKIPIPGKQAAVKSISPVRKIFRYAVAAVLVGLIALGTWYFIGDISKGDKQLLAQKDDSLQTEIYNHLHNINENEMEEYIEFDIAVLSDDTNISGVDMQDEDITLLFAEIPDKELENFLY